MKYMDGNVRDAKGKVKHPPYPKEWYARIVKETGDHFLLRKRLKRAPAPAAKAPKGGPAPAATKAAAAPNYGQRVPSAPAKGCSGCATSGSAGLGWGLALLGLLWIRRRNRR